MNSPYSGDASTIGLEWEMPVCNLCQSDLTSQFERYEQRRQAEWSEAERKAANKAQAHANPYAFILADAVPPKPECPAGLTTELGATLWEQDGSLLDMIHAAVNLSSAQDSPPLCCAKFVDVASNTHVPLLYYLCGSSQCLKAFADLSSDGNAAQNFSIINYSTLESDDDDEYSMQSTQQVHYHRQTRNNCV